MTVFTPESITPRPPARRFTQPETAGWHPGGWGFLVSITHGRGVRSMSAHLSRVDVKVGERVRAGQTIGAVGSSGNSTGPHLHFELRIRGAAFDPLTALR